MCIGSHYAVRTRALREIGGLGPELAEDFSTSFLPSAGSAIGPFAGGYLGELIGWRGLFVLPLVVSLGLIQLRAEGLVRLTDEPRGVERRGPRVVGVAEGGEVGHEHGAAGGAPFGRPCHAGGRVLVTPLAIAGGADRLPSHPRRARPGGSA